MKNFYFILFFLPSLFYSQIAEFNTNFVVNNGEVTELEMKWSLFENKLIGQFLDSKIIKSMEKQNLPTTQVFELKTYENDLNAKFLIDNYGNYKFQNNNIRIIVTINQLIKYSYKDDFTNKIYEINYTYVKK